MERNKHLKIGFFVLLTVILPLNTVTQAKGGVRRDFSVVTIQDDVCSPINESMSDRGKACQRNSDDISSELVAEMQSLSLNLENLTDGVLDLPQCGKTDKDIRILWSSSHPAIISAEGRVSQPRFDKSYVTLQATLVKDGQILRKDFLATVLPQTDTGKQRARVIVLTDGEDDDKASMIRFLLSANEFDVEGLVNTSSEFHWVGGKGWNAFKPVSWIKDYIALYAEVYHNLVRHDPHYPSPEYLLGKWKVGNINGVGEDEIRTEGAQLIVDVLLDHGDSRPVWVQAWGGCNTLSRALRIIEEDYPERMEEVAGKLRLFLIWEQDQSYQRYIRPHWEKWNIPTIISDQFDCMAYIWSKVLPAEVKSVFGADWMKRFILNGHGPLCDVYFNNNGAFNAEGDTPSFLHCIPNGLRSIESPAFGGWGGRYVYVRQNVWMDTPPTPAYHHPAGKYGIDNSWSKMMENYSNPDQVAIRTNYFKPIWRWFEAVQHDFAAHADWCVTEEYALANHHPVVLLKNTPLDIKAEPGEVVTLDASDTFDPDGDDLDFKWWNYMEAGTYPKQLTDDCHSPSVTLAIPDDARDGETIHMICEVTDSGTPSLTRYQRVVIHVKVDADCQNG